ncbi:hypothetical protein J5N97_027772 [Dioscorea zingiberensis]|uniref:Uncharacterized protein n=1 Tax=Dioscorea zingiberensis TaxID=325984 RepID=A0A9D5BXY2_9LILI|nr:hypothetical protein J5N97_027772 [Dioscorea zingiberensis]
MAPLLRAMARGCHQCRRRTKDLALRSQSSLMDDKPCSLFFCHKCLLTRKQRSQQSLGNTVNSCINGGTEANESLRESAVSKMWMVLPKRNLSEESDNEETEDVKLPKACNERKDEIFLKEKFECIMPNGREDGNADKDLHKEDVEMETINGSSDAREDK